MVKDESGSAPVAGLGGDGEQAAALDAVTLNEIARDEWERRRPGGVAHVGTSVSGSPVVFGGYRQDGVPYGLNSFLGEKTEAEVRKALARVDGCLFLEEWCRAHPNAAEGGKPTGGGAFVTVPIPDEDVPPRLRGPNPWKVMLRAVKP